MINEYLVWDFDGTLALRPEGWSGALCEIVSNEWPELQITAEQVRPYLKSGFPWHTPQVVRDSVSAEEWWQNLVPVFVGALTEGARLTDSEAHRVAMRVRHAYLDRGSWRLYDDTSRVLARLRDLGWKHVILSNHVPELSEIVDGLGLGGLLEAVYSSGCTGREKPNPAAFESVFADFPQARLGWMIGDSYAADIQGAAQAGMRSILVRNRHADAQCQCDTLEGVARVLAEDSLKHRTINTVVSG